MKLKSYYKFNSDDISTWKYVRFNSKTRVWTLNPNFKYEKESNQGRMEIDRCLKKDIISWSTWGHK